MELNIKTELKQRFSLFLMMLMLTSATLLNAQSSGEVINLGLYGGASTDFTWAYTNNRILSTVETPASLFYSDDTCGSWIQPFPIDSLEFTTNSTRRGWGGGATRVVSNWNGWVGALTKEQGGTLRSSVISFSEGDSSTFRTAYDGYLLNSINSSFNVNTSPTAITISDSWFYVGLTNALTRMNDTSTYGNHNILINFDTVSVNNTINWLAVSSDPTGYPVLIVANIPNDQYGKLYSFDGLSLTEITGTGIPSTYGFERIFIHPADTTLDTLFASVVLKAGNTRKLYRSYDGGSTWAHITFGGYETNWALQNADYNPDWVGLLTSSNGLRLSYPGVEKSDDLGDTWSLHMLPDNATATHPEDINYVIGSKNKGPKLSITGAGGTFNVMDNVGHSAVRITKIAQRDTTLYYVSTKAGLGYTSAYKDPSVTGVDQWEAPYGDFPISGVGTDSGVTSVAIDPDDDDHVIAGASDGFYVTTTGPSGFVNVQPPDWESGSNYDYTITDIKFITSDTVVAISGTGSNRLPDPSANYGNVWMSYDGGGHWSKTTPTDTDGSGATVDFEQGNSIIVGFGSSNTIIYVAAGYWDASDPKSGGQLWTSDDFGASWSFVNYGPTGANGTASMPIYDLDVHPDPDSNQVIYLASGENLDYAFCKSMDGGITYHYLNVTAHGAFSSVLVKLSQPAIVSVAARRKLYRYNTVLASPTVVFEGLPGEFVPDLETGSTLLGTTTGVYKLVEEPGSVTTIWNGDGDWTDNSLWSNGIPYDICNIIIESGAVNVDMEGKLHDIIISPEAALTIESGKSLEISGDLTLSSDETGYASFIDDGTMIVSGEITVERFITEDAWHYITPPISNALGGVFNGLWISYWDEVNTEWVELNSETEELLGGQGYKTWASSGTTGDATLEFIGELNTGDFSPMITLTGTPEETGWNMIGNDFPSALDWGTENNPNNDFILNNIDNTIYFWTGSQYATYNPSGDGTGTNGGSQYIASMQGFFVHANASSPEVTVPHSARLHHTQAFRKSRTVLDAISLTVHSSDYSDETIVIANENATSEFDEQFDAYKLNGLTNAPQFYSITENNRLTINNLPMVNHRIDAPLGFVPGIAESHSIEVAGTESFHEAVMITLEDLQEDLTIDLRINPMYTFYASEGDDPDRFILHINATSVDVENIDKPIENLIYYSNGSIVLENTQGNMLVGEIRVYDILGRLQFAEDLEGGAKQAFETLLGAGTYIVEIYNDDEIQTKKIVLK